MLPAVTPQRRVAFVSVLAAAGLLVLKLVTGLATGSLGLLSEALHSGTDLVAALLTFFAVGIAVRPADRHHAYGHGKAEHLAALAEASILALLSVVVGIAAVLRFVDPPDIEIAWWAFAVVLVVIVVDASRTTLSFRAARRYDSAALESNALHFGSDLAGSAAVLIGLLFANAGHPEADAVAAFFVALLVIAAAVRLVRRNVDVLMDTVPDDVEDAARAAINGVEGVELRRLRMRQAGGRQFADVVIGVPAGAAVGQGHAAADDVEDAIREALPMSDVVVHVEPGDEQEVRDRAHAAALAVPGVREVHNVTVLQVGAELRSRSTSSFPAICRSRTRTSWPSSSSARSAPPFRKPLTCTRTWSLWPKRPRAWRSSATVPRSSAWCSRKPAVRRASSVSSRAPRASSLI